MTVYSYYNLQQLDAEMTHPKMTSNKSLHIFQSDRFPRLGGGLEMVVSFFTRNNIINDTHLLERGPFICLYPNFLLYMNAAQPRSGRVPCIVGTDVHTRQRYMHSRWYIPAYVSAA
jgi:hypothetical protein